jgi:isopenicillin N synthase-like dioxygenase
MSSAKEGLVSNLARCFNMNEFKDGKAQQSLPPLLKDSEARVNRFIDKCHALCLQILELFATGLDIDENAGGSKWFASRHDRSSPSGSVFRLLYYPKLPPLDDYDEEKDIRAGAHSDYGTITLLFQRAGQPGLEILGEEKEGKEIWYPVPINPCNDPDLPILVNVGDLLHYWTGGLLKSAVHRVIFPQDGVGNDRYSIAYFCHAKDSAKLVPVPSKIVQEHVSGGSKGREILTAKEHLEIRLAATYTPAKEITP